VAACAQATTVGCLHGQTLLNLGYQVAEVTGLARLGPSGPPDKAALDCHSGQTPSRGPGPLRYTCTQGFHAPQLGSTLPLEE
jgi:hypothetical protein